MEEFRDRITDFLTDLNGKMQGWLWFALAAAVAVLLLLCIILLIVIGCKNAKIRKMKRAAEEQAEAQEQAERQRAEQERLAAQKQEEERIAARQRAEQESAAAQKREEERNAASAEQPAPAESGAEPMLSRPVASFESTARGGSTEKYIVKYDRAKNSWVVKKEGVDRVVRRTATKEEALSMARALCKKNDANLVVHKKDGKFQKQ